MTLPALMRGGLGDDVAVLSFSAGSPDVYGNPVPSFSSPTITRGIVWPISEQEQLVDEDVRIADWMLILPTSVALTSLDRVQARGLTFEVRGEPETFRNRAGDFLQRAQLRIVEGL